MVAAAANSSPAARAPVLNSWKEIALYLGRGIRTVQRYERAFRLPVRRLGVGTRCAVVALPEDLDAWLRVSNLYEGPSQSTLRVGDLPKSLQESIQEARELRRTSQSLRSANRLAVSNLFSTLSTIQGKMNAASRAIESCQKLKDLWR